MRILLLAAIAIFTMSLTTQAEEAPYRHVVLLKFQESAEPAEIKKLEEAFVALKDKIDLVQDLEWGMNQSPEGLDQGFTHVFFVTFKSKADLEKYLLHPEHEAFVAILKPQIDQVVVVDYVPVAK